MYQPYKWKHQYKITAKKKQAPIIRCMDAFRCVWRRLDDNWQNWRQLTCLTAFAWLSRSRAFVVILSRLIEWESDFHGDEKLGSKRVRSLFSRDTRTRYVCPSVTLCFFGILALSALPLPPKCLVSPTEVPHTTSLALIFFLFSFFFGRQNIILWHP